MALHPGHLSHVDGPVRSLFFESFPREIRDQIYRHILARDGPLEYRPRSTAENQCKPGYYEPGADEEWNKIKYVCRQMYAESAGLEIKCNDLLFTTQDWYDSEKSSEKLEPRDENSGVRHLLDFVSYSHDIWILRLRKVYIRSKAFQIDTTQLDWPVVNADYRPEDPRALFNVCERFPNITVLLKVNNFGIHLKSVRYLLENAKWLLVTRYKVLPKNLGWIDDHVDDEHNPDFFGTPMEIPVNFRFMPSEDLDEQLLNDFIDGEQASGNYHQDELLNLRNWLVEMYRFGL